MPEGSDPVLEAVDALQAAGLIVTPIGDDFLLWLVDGHTLNDQELIHLAASRGLLANGRLQ